MDVLSNFKDKPAEKRSEHENLALETPEKRHSKQQQQFIASFMKRALQDQYMLKRAHQNPFEKKNYIDKKSENQIPL